MPCLFRIAVLSIGVAAGLEAMTAQAVQMDIPGPSGSMLFGTRVVMLSNGNFVVVDPDGGGAAVGAVYLYGSAGNLISTLKGSSANDHIGDSVVALSNGNFVVISRTWDNAGTADVGAVTWVNGSSGLNGSVSPANSMVGSTALDGAVLSVTALNNGSYATCWGGWDNASIADAGASTWCDGNGVCAGNVSAANSLVGTHADDFNFCSIRKLSNGHYVVANERWDNGIGAPDAGAVTWMNGTARTVVGPITSANSLVGSNQADGVGRVAALANGNYVVASSGWDNANVGGTNNGAVTWCDGSSAGPRCVGAVSKTNSLYGGSDDDLVGKYITVLTNGNYVVASTNWHRGTTSGAGAVTWGNGSSGTRGLVTVTNSLVGSQTGDNVGFIIAALSNGHYVVGSPYWAKTTSGDVGAATWGDGIGGSTTGAVSATNSLVGSVSNDAVGRLITPLANGNYVVCSPSWSDSGFVANGGAATWANGSTAGPRAVGAVAAGDSLRGHANDFVALGCALPLENGHYVVRSNKSFSQKGATTWSDGSGGVTGYVSTANSFVGTVAGDELGSTVAAVGQGNYLVLLPSWGSGSGFGAVTWARGNAPLIGTVDASRSLVGSRPTDFVGNGVIRVFADGAYVVTSPAYNIAGNPAVGALTLGNAAFRLKGVIDSGNSVIGGLANYGFAMSFDYDTARKQLVVGRWKENLVTLFKTDAIFPDGFNE